MPGSQYPRSSQSNDPTQLLHELWEIVNEVLVMLTEIKTDFEAHTHNADGSEAGSYFTSPPRTDTADVTAGTASTFGAVPAKMSI